jgi:hypothetical protein
VREESRAAPALTGDESVEEMLAQLSAAVAEELRSVVAVSSCSRASVRTFHEAVLVAPVTRWRISLGGVGAARVSSPTARAS